MDRRTLPANLASLFNETSPSVLPPDVHVTDKITKLLAATVINAGVRGLLQRCRTQEGNLPRPGATGMREQGS